MTDFYARLKLALADRYAIERELGRGGMATVYLAQDLKHRRAVAIKVLHPSLAAALGPERFLREIGIAARLNHPHIVPLFDSGETDGQLWYAMPLVEGESLRDRLKREGQLPIAEALTVARDIAGAMGFAHSRAIIHRDIKPENILLAGGHALLTDLGIARAFDSDSGSLTETGMTVGTPGYMSPEQATGERLVDARSDIYSLGAVLYEMLAGEPPFTGPTHGAITAKQLQDPVPSIRRTRETVPESVDRALAKALARAPADRFTTAAEFASELTGDAEYGARGRQQDRRMRVPLLAAVAAGLILAVAAWWSGWLRSLPARGETKAGTPVRIAVLPFASLSPDASDAYFADGIAEEIGNALSRLSGLSVIARTSVMKERDRPVSDLAHDLNVSNFVEGSVRKLGSRARIAVKLIDATTQATRWSADYDVTLGDLLGVQSEVARQVAERLRVTFGTRQAEPLVNTDAYDLYLRAIFRLNERISRANFDSAISLLQRSIQLEPGFAPAHAALAQAYTGMLFNFDPDPRLRENARVELTRALSLDSTLADAYVVRGNIAYTEAEGWQIESALRDYQRSITLAPSHVAAHNALGGLYMHVGLLDEAKLEFERARDLDPLDQFAAPRVARTFWYRQQFDSAWAWFEKTPDWSREKALVLRYLGKSALGMALIDSAIAQREDLPSDLFSSRAVLLAGAGRRPEAEASINQAIRYREGVSHFHHAQYNVAAAYALLGERRQALEWLRRTAANGMPCYPLFAGDPNLDSLRKDPEFLTFLEEQRRVWEHYRQLVKARP